MKSDLWKKGIVFAIISLFIGASVIPSISGNLMDTNQIQSANSDSSNIRTALVLHTVEWQADEITSDMPIIKEDVDGVILRCFLQCAGYNVVYKENEEVDLNYIKNNLSADFIFYFGHGGYHDTDNDLRKDTVFIVTGEGWTDETEGKYQFEYENGWIEKGRINGKDFICFSPDLIRYYYNESAPQSLPADSLVFFATCDSIPDFSMAKAFVDDAGAATYMGWDKHVNDWANVIVSHIVIFLLYKGWDVEEICDTIDYEANFHRLLFSKLNYYGNGNLTIT